MNLLEGRARRAVLVAVGLLLAATALAGLVKAAAYKDHWCGDRPCHAPAGATGGPGVPELPRHDPCAQQHACGTVALSLTLVVQLAAAGLRRTVVPPSRPGLRAGAARAQRLLGRLLPTGLDHPPQPAV